jgi:2'-5' RNA ligase superfamily
MAGASAVPLHAASVSSTSGICKAHTSALCLIPPFDCVEQIQRIRCFRDKSFVRWPPHINLLYPFWQDAEGSFEQAAQRATQALAGMSPFKVCAH